MKRLTYYILICAVATLAACKKSFLDVVPKGQKVATTTADYDQLMNSSALYVVTFGGGWQGMSLMGDDIAAEAVNFNKASVTAQNAFKWADDIYPPTALSLEMSDYLKDLYTLNKVIEEVMQSQGGSDQQKRSLQAEALADRAWIHFNCVNFYGKPYLASTASQDLGFPIIDKADLTQTSFTRSTVQEVYDFIIKDLNTAIANLPLQNPVGATRWNKPAAEAMLGKVYLFMGKSKDALNMFQAAFNDMNLQTNRPRLYDYNKEFAAGGKFVPITSTGPNNSPGLNYDDVTESLIARTFYDGPYQGNSFGNDFVVLSPTAASLFTSSDLRLKFYAAQFPYNQVNPSGRLSKYSEQFVKYGIQLSELYLLRAEAEARQNDLSGAAADVEILRKNRMPAADVPVPANVKADQLAMLQFIMDERVREFATEGYRWFDMRRLSVDPLFTAQTYTHILYNDKGNTNTTLFTLPTKRLTLRLPPFLMNSNPNMPNNP